MHPLTIIIVFLFLIIAIYVGIKAGKSIRSINDFIAYYKNYNPAIIGLSLTMVIFGGGTIAGTVTEVRENGIIYALASMGYVICGAITAKFIIPKIDEKYNGMISVSDIFKYFYGPKAEKFSGLIALIFDIGATTSQLTVLGKTLAYFFHINNSIGLTVAGTVMIFYSTLGGIRSVTAMDIVKCILMLIFIPILASIVTLKAGGVLQILEYASQNNRLISSNTQTIEYILLFIFFTLPIHMMQPIVVQRLLLINNVEIARRAMYIYALIRSGLIWMTTMIALASFIALPILTPANEVLYSSITNLLPSFLQGFTIITIMAIVMCKADAHLNSSSIILTKNILPSFFRNYLSDLTIIRSITVAIGIISVSIALFNLPIIKIIIFIELLWSITIGLPLVFGILNFRTSYQLLWTYLLFSIPLSIMVLTFVPLIYAPLLIVFVSLIMFLSIYYRLNNKNIISLTNYDTRLNALKAQLFHLLSLRSNFRTILNYSTKKVENVGADYFAFSIFFSINLTIPYFMWDYSQPHICYITISMRFISVILSLVLLFKNFWPNNLKVYFPLYWHIVLMITLPFMTLFMLLLQNWSINWLINMSLSIFLLVLLTDWLSFIILTSLGVFLAIFIYRMFVGNISFPIDIHTSYLAIYTFIFSILIGIIFARRKEESLDSKIEGAKLLSGVIAHEMRTFLLTIRNYFEGFKRHCPALIETYNNAYDNNLSDSRISQEKIQVLRSMPENIQRTLNKAFACIDLLLINIKGPTTQDLNNIDNINQCVREAIHYYPISKIEKGYIHFNKIKDFIFRGDRQIVVHILFNLINNALYFTANKATPRIDIWSSEENNYNLLHFKDNGSGIYEMDINKIFDRFYSKSKKGTGLGLYFCRIAMNSLKGEIICHSIKGEYTEFIMKFPKNQKGI